MASRAPNPRGSPHSAFNQRHQNSAWATYSQKKNDWIKNHPEASSREIDVAARRIARELGL